MSRADILVKLNWVEEGVLRGLSGTVPATWASYSIVS